MPVCLSVEGIFRVLYKAGARIFSNSWGSTVNNYDIHAQQVDSFLWAFPNSLVLYSAVCAFFIPFMLSMTARFDSAGQLWLHRELLLLGGLAGREQERRGGGGHPERPAGLAGLLQQRGQRGRRRLRGQQLVRAAVLLRLSGRLLLPRCPCDSTYMRNLVNNFCP